MSTFNWDVVSSNSEKRNNPVNETPSCMSREYIRQAGQAKILNVKEKHLLVNILPQMQSITA